LERLEPSHTTEGNVKCHSHFGNNLTDPQDVKYGVAIGPSKSVRRHRPMRNESMYPHKNLHTNSHNTIYNSQKEETNQMSKDCWMEKQSEVYPDCGLLFDVQRKRVLIHEMIT
jgi:hypothetical protein